MDGPVDAPVDVPVDGTVPPAACAHMIAPRIATAERPSAVAVADVDHDGKRDLVVTEASKLDVMLGVGDGTFLPARQTALPAGAAPMALAVADVDGDGDLDVAIALAGSTDGVQLALGDGHGNFTLGARLAAITPTSVALGDVDGDGRIDVAAASAYGAGGVTVFLGTGGGAFAAPSIVDPGTVYDAVVVADMDSDHHLDLVAVANIPIMFGTAAITQVTVFRGNGDGTFAAPFAMYSNASLARQLVVGDVNGDGAPDIVTAGWLADDQQLLVESWLGAGDGTFAPRGSLVLYPDQPPDHLWLAGFDGAFRGVLALADFNADGKVDVAVTFWNRDVFEVIAGTGTGDLVGTRTEYATGHQPSYLTSSDVDGDGRPDVIVVDDSQKVEVALDTADGTLRAARSISVGLINAGLPVKIAVGDLDGDGHVDLVDGVSMYDVPFTFIGGFSVVCTSGPCAPGVLGPQLEPFSEASENDDLVLKDLDGDGDLDLVFTTDRLDLGYVDVWLYDGHGSFGARMDHTVGSLRDLAVGDLDGDHRPELVVAAVDGITVFANDGAGGFTAGTPFAGQSHVVLGDFNHDGKLDLGTSGDAATITIRLGNGDGTFGAPLDTPAPAVSQQLVVADVDGDGNLDLGGGTATATLIFTGHGDGTFTLTDTLAPAPGGLLALADLDRVAPIDIVGTTGALYRAGTTTSTEDWPIGATDFMDATGDGHADVVGLMLSRRANTAFVLASQCR